MKKARPLFAALSAITLGACSMTGIVPRNSWQALDDRAAADMVFICRTPPRVITAMRDLTPDLGNSLLPLNSRAASCVGSPDAAFRAYGEAVAGDMSRVDVEAPEAMEHMIPVNQAVVAILALANNDNQLTGFQVLTNSEQHSCSATLRLDDANVLHPVSASAHMAGQTNPTSFDSIARMRQIQNATGDYGCVDELESAQAILASPGFLTQMRQSFARRMAPGPRYRI